MKTDWVSFWHELQDLMEKHGLKQVFDSYADVPEKKAHPYRRVFKGDEVEGGESISVVAGNLKDFKPPTKRKLRRSRS